MKPPRLRFLGHVNGLVIYLVDGELVRNEIDIDFTCGGNEAVYPNYVPKGEIWIDDALSALDRTATLLHEIVERNLMMGKGWSYDRAHDAASAAERPFRRDLKRNPPRTIDINRATVALHALDPKKPAPKSGEHNREYPKVAAVGRKRKVAKLDREIHAFLKTSLRK
jgi:hypothetical protein